MDREAEDYEQGGDEKCIDFGAKKMSERGEYADGNNNIVNESDDGDQAVFPRRDRSRDLTKSEGDEKHDSEDDQEDRDDRLVGRLLTEYWADRVELFQGHHLLAALAERREHCILLRTLEVFHAQDIARVAGRSCREVAEVE